jgi:hypothetical protein
MIPTLKNNFKKNVYLLIIAAWLYTLSFFVSNHWAYNATPENVKYSLEKYIATQETAFNELLNDTASLSLLAGTETGEYATGLEDKPYYVFLYKPDSSGNPEIVYWSTPEMQLHKADLQRKDGIFPVSYTNVFFELIKRSISIRNVNYIIACVIPIRWDYSSIEENLYLKTGFANFPEIEKQYQISNNPNATRIYNGEKKALFGITGKKAVNELSPDYLSLTLKILGFVFILFFINVNVILLTNRKGFYYGLSFMLAALFLLRLLSYYFPFPFNSKNYELFDPSIYASSDIQRSLGDLLMNTLTVLWIMYFLKFNKKGIAENRIKINDSPKTAKIVGIISLAFLPVSTFAF